LHARDRYRRACSAIAGSEAATNRADSGHDHRRHRPLGAAIAFFDVQKRMQGQTAVGTPPTRAAPQSAVDIPPPAVTTQSTEKARAKIRKQHSTDPDRKKSLY
jgi:hypothetical protein